MFKQFLWKEWRQSYPVVLFVPATVLVFSLYMVLRHHATAEGLRYSMCFLFWPLSTLGITWAVFYQERTSETLEFLFSRPLAKHTIWFMKVSCGLIYILLMCVMSFTAYLLVAPFTELPSGSLILEPYLLVGLPLVSFRSLILDPYLLVGLCLTMSVFSVVLSVSTIPRRHGRAFGIVLGVFPFVIFVAAVILGTSPYFDVAMDKLREKPVVLSLLILGVSPPFLFLSFVFFNRGELLNIRRRRAIISYSVSACVILLILNCMESYVRSICRTPAAGGALTMAAVSPDGKTILLLIAERRDFRRNIFRAEGVSIYAIQSDGKNLRKLAGGNCSSASWSPTGEKIAFMREHGWFYSVLYVMDKDGRDPRKMETFSLRSRQAYSLITLFPGHLTARGCST